MLLLAYALLVASVDGALILTRADPPPRVAGPAGPETSQNPPVPAAAPVVPGTSVPPTPPPTTGTNTAGAAANVPTPAPAEAPTPDAASPIEASCNSDIQLSDAPDAPYSFLCSAGGVPITWPSDDITVFATGLDPVQTSALAVALEQWQATGRFTVSTVDAADSAQVVIHDGTLDNDEGGRTSVHYTCTTTCVFDHADVELSSTVSLNTTLWVATILHELGHAAGLNHVGRPSEVMYPTIAVTTTPAYGRGDTAGLEELATLRR